MQLSPELEQKMLRAIERDACITLPKATRKDGSAVVTVDGLQISLHRHLHKIAIGPLAPSQKLLPNCPTWACANPKHREIRSIRGRSKRRKRCPNGHLYKGNETPPGTRDRCKICLEARRARTRKTLVRKGFCHQGHKLTKDNVYLNTDKQGLIHRRCKKCHLAKTRAARAHRKEPA
jgi:hypothetical protein